MAAAHGGIGVGVNGISESKYQIGEKKKSAKNINMAWRNGKANERSVISVSAAWRRIVLRRASAAAAVAAANNGAHHGAAIMFMMA